MRDMFIVVEPLRNSYLQLHRNLLPWLRAHLVVEDFAFD